MIPCQLLCYCWSKCLISLTSETERDRDRDRDRETTTVILEEPVGKMGSMAMAAETSKKKAMWLYPKVMGFIPSERWGHSACYHLGNVYVFGGCCGGLHFSDVLVLNLDTMVWTNMVTSGHGPGPRDSHGAVIVGNQMVVFGGTNGSKKVNDVHILDLHSKEWSQPECKGNPPSPRESHTVTLVGDDKLVIFGGSGEGESNYLNDLHILDLKTMVWSNSEVRGDVPVPRDSHSATAVGHKLFVYGGDCGDRYQGDVDMLDIDSLTWSRLSVQGSSPGVRAGHAAVNIGTKVYILGGVGDRHYFSDAWVLDIFTCSWTQLDTCGQQPQGRFSHTAVVADSDIVIYGGCGEDERPLNDLLVLQLGAEHPNGRYNVSMCKMFGNHWNQGRRSALRGENQSCMKTKLMGNNIEIVRRKDHEQKSETKNSIQFMSETLHPKRRRTTNLKAWEIESEQEEHSLSLSQHSSPSQSDQEQTPVRKISDSVTSSQGLRLLKHMNQSPTTSQPYNICRTSQNDQLRNTVQCTLPQDLYSGQQSQLKPEQQQQQQLLHIVHSSKQKEHKSLETGHVQNLIGAEVRGRVDGAFDSGFLMTATLNGKIYRGVLFTPGPGVFSRANIVGENAAHTHIPNPNSKHHHHHHVEPSKGLQQRPTATMPEATESLTLIRQKAAAHAHAHVHGGVSPPVPIIKPTTSSSLPINQLRDDLQGVFLTLGGPGNGSSV